MKKFLIKYKLEKGQMIPLVVLMLFVIIGMVALILDGGSIMSNRRTAQAAADAGALAGAQRACLGKSDAKSVAEYYAITKNNATTAIATVVGTQVTVKTTVENSSFFAKFFGEFTLEASAEATAGCFGVRGVSPLPLAWNCRAPSVGGGPFDPLYGCQIQTLSWNLIGPMVNPNWDPPSERKTSVSISDYDGNIKDYFMSGTSIVDSAGIPPEQIYIIIDSDKICLEDDLLNGVVRCDLDGDGKKDIQLGGDRGWLYLTADTSDIGAWI
ncbi:MAG: pilus assembly protein TadG-related protein, partial [Chloroflexota bacterium]